MNLKKQIETKWDTHPNKFIVTVTLGEIRDLIKEAKKEVFDIFEKYAKGIDKGHTDNKFWDWFKNTRKFQGEKH